MILKNCTFYNENFKKEFGDIQIEDSKIINIGILPEDGIDYSGKIIFPGFIDIHVHGANGGDFSDANVESIEKMAKYLLSNGITSFCGTTMTLSKDSLLNIATTSKEYSNKYSKLVGINLEGPYISKIKKGAQNEEFVRSGCIDEIREINDASGNNVKIITIAPEAFDSDDFIKELSKDITISIGHSNATYEECIKAYESGASHMTHLYNAMTPLHHRDPGCVGAAFDSNVTCELICDMNHIAPSVVRSTFKMLGENRICVISDSMRAAGLGDGSFEFGGQTVYVKDSNSVARLEDGTIAASVSNIFESFKKLINNGIDISIALKACTINPAKIIKEDERIGSIAIGKDADLIVCDENLNILEVYSHGILA